MIGCRWSVLWWGIVHVVFRDIHTAINNKYPCHIYWFPLPSSTLTRQCQDHDQPNASARTPVACKRLSTTNRNAIAGTRGSISRAALTVLRVEEIAKAAAVLPAARHVCKVCVLKVVAVVRSIRIVGCPVYVNLSGIGRADVPVVVDLHLRGGGEWCGEEGDEGGGWEVHGCVMFFCERLEWLFVDRWRDCWVWETDRKRKLWESEMGQFISSGR